MPHKEIHVNATYNNYIAFQHEFKSFQLWAFHPSTPERERERKNFKTRTKSMYM